MLSRHLRRAPAQPAGVQEADDAQLVEPEEGNAENPSQRRYAAETLSPALGDSKVRLGDDPRRRALKHKQLLRFGCDLRDKLDGAGAGADNCHTFAFERYARVPICGMKFWP